MSSNPLPSRIVKLSAGNGPGRSGDPFAGEETERDD